MTPEETLQVAGGVGAEPPLEKLASAFPLNLKI